MTALFKKFGATTVTAAALAALIGGGQVAQATPIVFDIVEGLAANRVEESGIGLTQEGNNQWWYHNHASSWANQPTHINDYYYSPEAWSGTEGGGDWGGWADAYGWGDRSQNGSRGDMLNADWNSVWRVSGAEPGDAIAFRPHNNLQTAVEWRAHADGLVDINYDFQVHENAQTRFYLYHWDGAVLHLLGDSNVMQGANVGNTNASGSFNIADLQISEGDSILLHNVAWNYDGGQLAVARGDITFVPEPASLALLAAGGVLLVMRRHQQACRA